MGLPARARWGLDIVQTVQEKGGFICVYHIVNAFESVGWFAQEQANECAARFSVKQDLISGAGPTSTSGALLARGHGNCPLGLNLRSTNRSLLCDPES